MVNSFSSITGSNVSKTSTGCIGSGKYAEFDPIHIDTPASTDTHLLINAYNVNDGHSDDEGNDCFVGNEKSEWDGVYIKKDTENDWNFIGFLEGIDKEWCQTEFDISSYMKDKVGNYSVCVVPSDDGSKKMKQKKSKWCVPIKSCHLISDVDQDNGPAKLSNLSETNNNVSVTVTAKVAGTYTVEFKLKKNKVFATCKTTFSVKANTPTNVTGVLVTNPRYYSNWSYLPTNTYKLVAILYDNDYQIRHLKHIFYTHSPNNLLSIVSTIYDLSESSWTGNSSADKQKLATTCQTPMILGILSNVGSSTNTTYVDIYVDTVYVGTSKISANQKNWYLQFGSTDIINNSAKILSVGNHELTSIYTTVPTSTIGVKYSLGSGSVIMNPNVTLTNISGAPNITKMYVYLDNYFSGDSLSFTSSGLSLVSGLSVSGSYSSGKLTLTLSYNNGVVGTLSDYAKILSNVRYTSSSTNASVYDLFPTRNVSWQVYTTTNSNYSTVQKSTVSILQPPLIINNGVTNTFYYNGGKILVNGGINIFSANKISSAVIQITTNYYSNQDVLSFVNNNSNLYGNITGTFNTTDGKLTLTSLNDSASLLNWQNAITSLCYNNTSLSPNTSVRTIVYNIKDVNLLSSASVSCSLNVSSTNVNNVCPLIMCCGRIISSFTKNVSFIANPDITISATSIRNAVITMSGSSSNSTLSFTNTDSVLYGNISASKSGGGSTYTLTLQSSGYTATIGQWQNAIRNIKCTISSSNSFTGRITYQISDNNSKTNSSSQSVVTFLDCWRKNRSRGYTASSTPYYTISMGEPTYISQSTLYSSTAPKYNLIIDSPSMIYPVIKYLDDVENLAETYNRCPTISGTCAPNVVLKIKIDNDDEEYYTSSDLNSKWNFKITKPLSDDRTFVATDTVSLLSSSVYSVSILSSLPVVIVTNIGLSNDSGSSSTDFITASANQTITGTLSEVLNVGDIVYGSVDNGENWVDVTTYVTGTSLSWPNVTLLQGYYNVADNTMRLIKFKVANSAGDGIITDQYYLLINQLANPTIDSLVYLASDTVKLIGTCDPNSIMILSYVSQGVTQTVTINPDKDGNWIFIAPPLLSGTYIFTASSNDPMTGATSSHSVTKTAIIDTSLPVIFDIVIGMDTGPYNTDCITNNVVQNIGATISRILYANEYILGSIDNGKTWVNMQNYVNETSILWTNVSLVSGTNCIKFQALNSVSGAGGVIATQQYILDSVAPVIETNNIIIDINTKSITIYFTEVESWMNTNVIPGINEFTIIRYDVNGTLMTSPTISSFSYLTTKILSIILNPNDELNSDDNFYISYNGTSITDMGGNLLSPFTNFLIFNPNIVSANNDSNTNIDAINPIGNILNNDAGQNVTVVNINTGQTVSVNPIDINQNSSFVINPTIIKGTYGSLYLGSDGTYIYYVDYTNLSIRALNGYDTLTDYFTYQISDGVNTDSAILSIEITDIVPVSQNLSYTNKVNNVININFVANDFKNSSMTYQIITYPLHGQLSTLINDKISYTPNSSYVGDDSFTYRSFNGLTYSDPSNVQVVITDNITIMNLSYVTKTNTDIIIQLSASDTSNNSMVYSIVSNPSNGTLSAISGNQIIFTPNDSFNGSDVFTYKAFNGFIYSDVGTVNIIVTNVVPYAQNAFYTIALNTSKAVTLEALDSSNNSMTFSVVTGPSHGTLSSISGNQIIYTSNNSFVGEDSFSYRAYNGIIYSDPATITFNVTDIIPTSIDKSYTTEINTNILVTMEASDRLNNGMVYFIVSNPLHGSLSSISENKVTYTPNNSYVGSDNFTYRAYNGIIYSSPATISLNVIDVITINDLSYTTPMNTNKAINLFAVDTSNNNITYSIVSNPEHGSLSAISGNYIEYTPNSMYIGTDSFTYRANNGSIYSDIGTVTITINDVPTTKNKTYTIIVNKNINVTLEASDSSNNNMTYFIVSSPTNGTLSELSGNRILYTPTTSYVGQDNFTYKAYNGVEYSNLSIVYINITTPCFGKGTKIMCLVEGKEIYLPIENIKVGTLIKTYKYGYKRLKFIGKLTILNNEHVLDTMYKIVLPNINNEPLYLTGKHSILVDIESITPKQKANLVKVMGKIKNIGDKILLPAFLSEHAEKCKKPELMDIYHIVLENSDEKGIYGVYSNGILSETTSEFHFVRFF